MILIDLRVATQKAMVYVNRDLYTRVLHLFPQQKLTNKKYVNSWVTISSTVYSYNPESVVHIILSSNSDSDVGGCDNSSRELGRG